MYANIVIIILGMEKFFDLFRIFEEQGKIFMLLKQCIQDTVPFVIFLLVWVNFLATLSLAMDIDFDFEDYVGVPKYFTLVIIFLRSSVGDINAPFIRFGASGVLKFGSLSVSEVKNTVKYNVMLTLMWVKFVFELYFLNIIMLNFLIAFIQDSHDKFMSQSKLVIYQNKIQLILEYYQIRDFLDRKNLCEMEGCNMVAIFMKVKESSFEQVWEG